VTCQSKGSHSLSNGEPQKMAATAITLLPSSISFPWLSEKEQLFGVVSARIHQK